MKRFARIALKQLFVRIAIVALLPFAVAPDVQAKCPGPEVINGVDDGDGCADTVFVILRLNIRDPRTEQLVQSTVTIRGNQQKRERQVNGAFETILATPGVYTVDVGADGYLPRTYRLRLTRGTALTLGVDLQPR